jgi:uncharacterized protein (TIGR03435 family)
MMRVFANVSLICFLSGAAFGQAATTKTPAATPAFDIADVHVSPRTDWLKKPANNMQGGYLLAGRYELHRATMLDLIKTAYPIDPDKVYGGPSWLDYDRFEVAAKAPAGTRPEDLKLMLQSLLAARFKLVVKMDTRPLPAYVLSVGTGKPKMKPADGSGSSGCQSVRGAEPRTTNVQCRGVTMEAFAAELRRRADPASRNIPVVDSTGLEGAWDFDLQYGATVIALNTGITTQEGGGITEAVDKQLGLTLELSKAPQPVVVVESVNEQPAANPPGVSTALPPLPPPEFEVASIRPCDGTGGGLAPRFEPGGRVTANCFPLLTLINRVFNVNPSSQQVAGVPKWLAADSNENYLSLVAKAPAGSVPDAVNTAQPQDILNAMLRALLIDRYKLAFHYEDRPVDAYTLVAAKPKLAKANPENRTGCARRNGAGVTPGLACQNVTMAQFAEQIQAYDTSILYPVLDETGIEGAWDFTLSYNPLANAAGLLAQAAAEARARAGVDAPAPSAEPSAPSGSVTFADALEKQLGLKLEKHKRPEPVLVIDHMEQKPTDN